MSMVQRVQVKMKGRAGKIAKKIIGPCLAILIFAGAGILQSCFLNTSNTFTADKPCGDSADEDFCGFQTLLKPGGCFTSGCHSEWLDYDSFEDYVADGLITKGAPGSSSIYTKLAGAGSGGNMPLGSYPDLESSSLSDLSDYITGL